MCFFSLLMPVFGTLFVRRTLNLLSELTNCDEAFYSRSQLGLMFLPCRQVKFIFTTHAGGTQLEIP